MELLGLKFRGGGGGGGGGSEVGIVSNGDEIATSQASRMGYVSTAGSCTVLSHSRPRNSFAKISGSVIYPTLNADPKLCCILFDI